MIRPDNFALGLKQLKIAIESRLVAAGANMAVNSVFMATGDGLDRDICALVSIAAVPCDAPKMVVQFTRQEILDCADGVNRGDVRDKINLYWSAYKHFRESPERAWRSSRLQNGKAKPPADPGIEPPLAVPQRPPAVN